MLYIFSTILWIIVTSFFLYHWTHPDPHTFMPEIGSVISYSLAEASTVLYLLFLLFLFSYQSKRKAAWVVAILIVLFFVFFIIYDPPCQSCPSRILNLDD